MKLDKSDLQLETIVSRINRKELDLQPDFQRGEIWDTKRVQRLIDSILRDWYVPAVHVVLDTEGNEVVLDGQQRLAAIRDFFADKVRIDGRIEPPDTKIEALAGLRYSQLPVAIRKSVDRFVLQVVTLSEYDPQEPNELFFRLNQSYNLTPPEKRNALHGPARDQVREIVDNLYRAGLLNQSKIGFSNGRLAYDDIIARTAVAIALGSLRIHINNNVVEDFYRTRPFDQWNVSAVIQAGIDLRDLIGICSSPVRFNKGTLQTWLIFCYRHNDTVGRLPRTLLKAFEKDRAALKADGELHSIGYSVTDSEVIGAILRLYEDRASYRVTDVSSVLIRDLCLELYSQFVFNKPASQDTGGLLDYIRSAPESSSRAFQDFLKENSNYGQLPKNDPSYQSR